MKREMLKLFSESEKRPVGLDLVDGRGNQLKLIRKIIERWDWIDRLGTSAKQKKPSHQFNVMQATKLSQTSLL